ncbi:MAG: oligosaccharide flippase family protein [Salibacteraceae bacterium]
MQNVVGSESYGLFFTLFNLSIIFNFILDAGISNYNNNSVAKNSNFLATQFSSLAGLKLMLGIVYLILSLVSGYILNYSGIELKLLLFLSLNQFLLSFILFLRSNISGLQIFWLDSILSILDRTLLILICAVLLWSPWVKESFRIEWLAYSQTAAYLTTLIVSYVIVVSKSKTQFRIPNKQFIFDTLQKSLPFAFIILFMTLYFRVDAIMIEQLLPDGKYQAGLYAQGYRFLDMINNFIFLFIGILFPLLSKQISLNEPIKKLVQFCIEILAIPTLFVLGLGIFLSHEIIQLSYNDVQSESGISLMILLCSYLPLIFGQVYGTVLTAGGKLKEMIVISGLSFFVNIAMNFVLIPQMGIVGAAITSLLSQFVMAIGCYVLAYKFYKLNIPSIKLISSIVGLVVVLISLRYFQNFISSKDIFIVLVSVSIVISLIFSAVRIKEFKELKSLKK